MKHVNRRQLSALALAAMTAVTSPALAEKVTLNAIGSTISIQGELISFDGEIYTVQTNVGELKVRADRSMCEGDACPDLSEMQTALYLAGSGKVTGALIPSLAQAYFGGLNADVARDDANQGRTYFELEDQDGKDLMMTLVHSNSAKGIDGLVARELDAAFTTRPVTALEEEAASVVGLPPLRSEEQESIIAYDSLLLVTHPSNPIQAMSEMDIAAIFSGDISNWTDFGYENGAINVYLREDGSNSRDLLTSVLLKPHRKKMGVNITVLNTDAEIADAVRADPKGIGLTSFANRDGVRALEIEGVCGIRTPASEFSIKTGEYPLAQPIYFYHSAEATTDPTMNGFAEFISSEDAQAHIRSAGFLDRDIVVEPLNTQGLRVTHTLMGNETAQELQTTRNMLRLMSYADQLSTTIRLDGGSIDLDSEDYENLEMVAKLIGSSEYDGATFYFMGFSDSVGRAELNQFVALQRAEIVRQALVSRYPELSDRVKAQSIGYGELSPLGCNETRPGRAKNRRVEIWVQRPLAVAAR